ncbi:MAG: BLUF domain-containing protein [Acidiferrobacterales bacterium]|nr:BLUF domain-containing protein [Acidiferrobacterales bacterium]
MIRTVLHISETTAREPKVHAKRIKGIETLSKMANERHGMSGLLAVNERYFFHVLEGSEPEISQLLDNIQIDFRNKNFEIIFDVYWEHRLFSNWLLMTEYSMDDSARIRELLSFNIDALTLLKEEQFDRLQTIVSQKFH